MYCLLLVMLVAWPDALLNIVGSSHGWEAGEGSFVCHCTGEFSWLDSVFTFILQVVVLVK